MKTKYHNLFYNPEYRDIEYEYRTPIAFDLDSVLNELGYDLGQAIADNWGLTLKDIRAVDKEHGYEKFHFEVRGASYKEVAHTVDQFILNRSMDVGQSPYMREVLEYVFKSTCVPITVVTARRPEAIDVTWKWLSYNIGVPFRCFIVNGEPKSKVLNFLDCKIFIDDRWKTIKGLMNTVPYPVLYRRPWNQGRPDKLPVVEVNTLRDVIPLFNILTGRVPTAWPKGLSFPKP